MNNKEIFEKTVWKAIASLGIPSLISIFVMILYNMADMYFISFLHDYTQIAAVSLIMPVFSLMTAFSTMLGNGGCTLIAQALGAGDKAQARSYASLCVWAMIVTGCVIAVGCFLFCNPLLQFLGANEEMWDYAGKYLLILAAGAPVILLNYGLGCMMRGEGAIKPGLLANMISTVANILLDPLFILVFRMGVTGAAAATVMGNVMGAVFLAWYKRRHEMILTFSPKPARGHVRRIGRVVSLGLPNAASTILSGLASTFSNQLLVGYGTEAVAAMAASGKSIMVVGMMQMGICMGVQPLMAYCYGGKDFSRLKEVLQKLLILTLALGLGLGGMGLLGSRVLVALFIEDAGVLAMGQRMVRIQLISAPFLGMFYISNNFMQATGKAAAATATAVLRQGVLLMPLLYVFEAFMLLPGIPAAHVAADLGAILIAGGLAAVYYHSIMGGADLQGKRKQAR